MEVQTQPQVYGSDASVSTLPVSARKNVAELRSFRDSKPDVVELDDDKYDEYEEVFDKDAVERDRDSKRDEIERQRQALEDAARQIEETGAIGSKHASKGLRFISTVLGLAATFVVAKGSSKIAIETLKTAAKSGSIKSGVEAISKLKEPALKTLGKVSELTKKIIENPKIQEKIAQVQSSNIATKAKAFLENKNVAKALEPLKNTLKSVKDIKINGKTIQSATENTMATVTTGSVLVDSLTGRNNHKSNVEIATGI